MINDILSLIVRSNIALAVCVLGVLALRSPIRRLAGARIAYALWLLPPLAGAACFAPGRIEVVNLSAIAPINLASAALTSPSAAPLTAPIATPIGAYAVPFTLDPSTVLAAWICGVAISLIVLVLRQTRFARALGRLELRTDLGAGVVAAESSAHGPAVLGVLRPVIITPADFDARFSSEERRIVLEHERAHLAQGDPLINAFAAVLACVNWFNPFVHLGVRALRIDQELACDAAVLATAARRSYAEAILKTQIAAGAPLGCAWPSHSLSALKERIAMLKNNLPTRTQRVLGVCAVGMASFTACAVAWAAQPPRVVVSQSSASTVHALPAATPLSPDPLSAPAAYVAPASNGAPTAYAEAELAGADPDADTPDINADDANAEDESDVADAAAAADADADQTDRDAADQEDDDANARAGSDLNESGDGLVTIDGRTMRMGDLTPAQRARVHAAVNRAMQAQHAAMARAHIAMRQAQRASARAQLAERIEASPQMRAEIAALEAEASRLAEATRLSAEERQAMRTDIHVRAERIRQMAQQMAEAARAQARAELDRSARDRRGGDNTDN